MGGKRAPSANGASKIKYMRIKNATSNLKGQYVFYYLETLFPPSN